MNYEPDSDAIAMEFEVGEEVLIDDPYIADEELVQEEVEDQDDGYDQNDEEQSDQDDTQQQQQNSEHNEAMDGDGDGSDVAEDGQEDTSSLAAENTSHQQINHPIPIDHQSIACTRKKGTANARNSAASKNSLPDKSTARTSSKTGSQVVPSMDMILSEPQTKFVIISDSRPDAPFSHCLCTARPMISPSESNGKPQFCQAIDRFDGKLIGCTNQAKLTLLFRTSKRVPYRVFCEVHSTRLRRHHCCPGCGIFLTQGDFLQCRCTSKQVHLFHKSCQLVNASKIGPDKQHCPHCGQISNLNSVRIQMNGPVLNESSFYYLWQTPLLKNSTARISSKASSPKSSASSPTHEDEPGVQLNIVDSEKNLSLSGLAFGLERQQLESILLALNNGERKAQVLKTSSNKNLVNLVKCGDVEKVTVILSQGFDPNTRFEDHENETLLHNASRAGHLIIAHLLIQAGANVDATNNQLLTPLMAAVEAGKINVISYLIKAGASVDSRGDYGMNALHIAAKNGNCEAVKILLESPKIKSQINSQDSGGYTALSYLTELAQLQTVQMLLDAGADPNIQDSEGNVCLHWAAYSGDVSMVEAFIDLTPENVPNENFDTPLHIAARKNNHEVVQFLLTRNADPTLLNKSNESPFMCCPENSESALALSLKMDLARAANKRKFSDKFLHRDISKGREKCPISIVNGVDDEQSPNDYTYVVSNCETTQNNVDRTISSLSYCKCENNCTSDRCLCASMSFKCWYDREGKLVDEFNFDDPPMIFECNRACGCWSNCGNRIVQQGITARLQVFKSPGQKGWGVRTLNEIPKGAFVCEYVGEVISDSEANHRQDDSYLFDLDKRDGETLHCLDARFYGNVSRFINHGCDPNITPVKVFIDHQDLSFPRMALFANRKIRPYEEIRFDYGEKFWVIKYKWFTCECNSYVCRYSKETIHKTLAPHYKRIAEEQAQQQLQQQVQQQQQNNHSTDTINGHTYVVNGTS